MGLLLSEDIFFIYTILSFVLLFFIAKIPFICRRNLITLVIEQIVRAINATSISTKDLSFVCLILDNVKI